MFCFKRLFNYTRLAVCAVIILVTLSSCQGGRGNNAELIASYSDGIYPLKVSFTDTDWVFLLNDTKEGYYSVSAAPDPKEFYYIHYIDDVTIRRFYAGGNSVVWSEMSDSGITYMYYTDGMDAADYAFGIEQDRQQLSDSVGLDGNKLYCCYDQSDSYEVLLYEMNIGGSGKRIITKIPYNEKIPRIVFSVKNGYMCIAVDEQVSVLQVSDRRVLTSFSLQKNSEIKYLTYDSEYDVCSAYFSSGGDNVIVLVRGDGRSKTAYRFPEGTEAYEDYVDMSGGKLRWIENKGNSFKYEELDIKDGNKTEKNQVFSFTYKDGELYTLRYADNANKVELRKE